MRREGRRAALVTGAARNIGRATAVELARQGLEVVVHTRRDERAAGEVADLIEREGSAARVITADLTRRDEVVAMIEEVGAVDVLVNNAAVRPHRPFADIAWDEWRSVFTITVDTPFLLCQAFLPGMQERGWGRVINMTGVRATLGAPGRASSSAAKHAVVGLTRALANEYGPHGITANVVCPGTIVTEQDRADGSRLASRDGIGALGRFGEPEEVARVIGFLSSDAGGYVTGQSIGANGGELML